MIRIQKAIATALCLAGLAAQALCAETIKSTFYLFEKSVGTNTWTRDGDTATSDSNLNIPGMKVESHLKLQWKGDAIVSFDWTEKAAQNSAHFTWQNKELTMVLNGGAPIKQPNVTFEKCAYFASFHPQVLSTLWSYVKDATGPINPPVLIIGNAKSMALSTTISGKLAMVSGEQRTLRMAKVNLAGLDVNCAFDAQTGAPYGFQVPVQKFHVVRDGAEAVFEDPATKFKELSQPTLKTETIEKVDSPMTDGTALACTVVKPVGDDPVPVILIRTPYGRKASALEGDWWASRGYALVAQDVRGRGDSGGEWDPFNREVGDGYDTLQWLTKQPWCNGNVGMIGGSYLGFVQWAAAVTKHPALKCIIPQVSPPDPTRNIPMENGAFMLYGSLWWTRIVKDKDANLAAIKQKVDSVKALNALPISRADDFMFGSSVSFFDQWTKRTTIEDWPGSFRQDQIASVTIPVMHISGTWDGDGVGTKLHWEALRAAKGNQWLIFGPWTHAFNTTSKVGGVDYGSQSILELNSTYLRFFDTYLKQKQVGMDKVPRVKFFISGANYWESASDFPLPGYQQQRLYLGSGDAKSSASTASLSPTPGAGKDRYVYDPLKIKADKEPSMDDESLNIPAEMLSDSTLIYRSSAFQQPTVITGPVDVTLRFSTTARDATLHALICDESPNGKLQVVGSPGTQRVSYLDRTLKPLVPGRIYTVIVRPWWFAHQFDIGHKLVLIVRSDMFPSFARNPGTGKWEGTTTRYVRATHTIHKSAPNTSYITFYTNP